MRKKNISKQSRVFPIFQKKKKKCLKNWVFQKPSWVFNKIINWVFSADRLKYSCWCFEISLYRPCSSFHYLLCLLFALTTASIFFPSPQTFFAFSIKTEIINLLCIKAPCLMNGMEASLRSWNPCKCVLWSVVQAMVNKYVQCFMIVLTCYLIWFVHYLSCFG